MGCILRRELLYIKLAGALACCSGPLCICCRLLCTLVFRFLCVLSFLSRFFVGGGEILIDPCVSTVPCYFEVYIYHEL